MKRHNLAAFSLLAVLALGTPVFSQSQPEAHHTDQSANAGQQDMMMNMMRMMMGGGQMGMGGMDMTQHVEGRIAFLRAELKITGSQAKLWEAFADALRKNASGMMAANMPMMGAAMKKGLVEKLAAQERMLAARLEGARAMKAALEPLYAAFDEQQRKTADELLQPHMGLMAGGMMQGGMGTMMQGGMMPNQ